MFITCFGCFKGWTPTELEKAEVRTIYNIQGFLRCMVTHTCLIDLGNAQMCQSYVELPCPVGSLEPAQPSVAKVTDTREQVDQAPVSLDYHGQVVPEDLTSF